MAEAPQAQVSPQEGVPEPLPPDGPAHDARHIPWGCHSVSPSFMSSLSHPANLFAAPSLALGMEPVPTHCEAEFPFYRGGNRPRNNASPDHCLVERNHEAPCLPWRPSPCVCPPTPPRAPTGWEEAEGAGWGKAEAGVGEGKVGGRAPARGRRQDLDWRTVGVAGWVKEDCKCQQEPSP